MFEKVNPSHPDKIADRIAGAIVDLAYSKEENPKIAAEVLIGHGFCYIIIETSVSLKEEEIISCLVRSKADSIVFEKEFLDVIKKAKEKGLTRLPC